ncbi:MAG: amidohydrolase family protein [Eubacteriales bacterium]
MSEILKIEDIDKLFYDERLRNFLPDKMIDIHTHIWLEKFGIEAENSPVRTVTWPSLVAKENSIEDLLQTYELMFPGKSVTPLIFSQVSLDVDINACNAYVQACSTKHKIPSLILLKPHQSADDIEELINKGGFLGCKVYLNFAPSAIPEKEICIYDFLPPHQLKVLDKLSAIVMLHIPRDGRLKDPVNLSLLLEIEKNYPNLKLIVAHVGRAYCPEDVGNAFELLSQTKNMVFDFAANTNVDVFRQLIKAVGPKRILFGSDLPILKMRTRRICENGNYVNLVPKGLYGDVSGDKHMREVEGPEAEKLTFFMYEEMDAMRLAAEAEGLTRPEIEDIFYNNAVRIINNAFGGDYFEKP